MIKTVDANYIANYVKDKFCDTRQSSVWALCLNITGNGYHVGIADANIEGYTPTGLYVDEPKYYAAEDILDEANKLLFPERSLEETFNIQMSSMFSKR